MKAWITLQVGATLFPTVFFAARVTANTALQITLQVDSGTPVTIVDDNDLTNDLNAADGTIDFTTTVDGVLAADGRVEQVNGPIRRFLDLSARTIGGQAVFHNTDVATHTVTVTIDSDTFVAPGSPLGWAVFYQGTADDASAASVEIAPKNDVEAFVDPGTGFVPLLTAPISVPIPPTPAVDQPVAIEDVGQRGLDTTGDAVRSRLVWTFNPGPDDEIRLPDSQGFDALFMSVFNEQDACVADMNKAATKVVTVAETSDQKCLRTTGDVTACVDANDEPKTVKAEGQLLKRFGFVCSVPPAFGANLGTCCEGGVNDGAICSGPPGCASGVCSAGACIDGAAEGAVNAITHDLFGATVNTSDAFKRCQSAVRKAAAADHAYRWKVFTKCKQVNIGSLSTEADFVTTCLGPPQPDLGGKIPSLETKITTAVQKRCIDKGIGPLSTVLPGACASESDVAYAACIARRVACRFCLGARGADDIVAPLDCDVFDDGTANSSCP